MSKAKLRTTGTVYHVYHNDTGEAIRGLDGLSGPYIIPIGGVSVSAGFKDGNAYWHETFGLTQEEFVRDFEELLE